MKQVGSISILHIIFLSITVIGLKNHVTILPPILQIVGRDGWLSVLLATASMLIWASLVILIHNRSNGNSMKEWLLEKIGSKWSAIFRYTISLFLLLLAAFTMKETLQWVTTTFLSETPVILLLILYVVLCLSLAITSLQTIAMVNVLVLAVVIVFGFFVAFTNMQVKDYTLLLPVFEHGIKPIVLGMIYPASGFVELLLLLFIQHKIKGRLRYSHFVWMIGILTMLTIGPLIGAITEFGPIEAAKQTYPAYEEWGIVSIGRYIEHVDFLSIYQWLTGAFIRVGLILYIVIDLLNMENETKRVWKWIGPVFFSICGSLFLLNDNHFLKLKGQYFLTGTFIFLFLLSLFLTFIALFSLKSFKRRSRQI